MNTIWNNIKGKLNVKFNRKSASGRSTGNFRTTKVDTTHYTTADEFYIGVSSEKPITVYLPTTPADGKIIIVKAEMKPPMSGRKITIATTDGTKIDGYSDATITVSHDCKTLLYHNYGWHIIS